MKKIILFFIFISTLNFSCRGLITPKSSYTIESKKVYYRNLEVVGANSASFKNISFIKDSCEYRDYAKDKNYVYYKEKRVEDADPNTFTMVDQGYYKDKKYLYFAGKRLEGSDSSKKTEIVKDNKITDCIPWGDGGCVLNNGKMYLNGEIYRK